MTTQKRNGQTERSLTESEELYRLLAEHSTDMISKHTPEGAYTYVSPACRFLLGYEPEELVGHDAYEFFHPEDLQEIREAHSAILERSDTSTVTYRIRRKDGSYIWFETTSKTIRDEQTGEVKEIIAVSRDITERKQVEEELHKSNQRIASILESITEDFYALDTEWRFTYINEGTLGAIRRAKGAELKREDLLKKSMWELFPELVGSEFYHKYHEVLREHKTVHVEAYSPLRHAWVEAHVYPSEEGLSVYLQDITERKRAEEKLRKSEGRLRRAVEIETVGVIFFRTDGTITDANDAFLGMSGYSREDLIEGLVRWDQMTPPEWMPHSLKAVEEFESTGRTIPYEKEYIRKDGSRWWGLFAATRLDEQEGVEFIIDITESKRGEEDLRRSKHRIANILESITDAFFAVDCHWKFTYVNGQAEQVWQRSREELLGRSIWEEFPEAEDSMFHKKYQDAMESGNPVHFEACYGPLDHWVEVHAYPFEEGLAVYFQDITERKRMEEELRKSEERFRATFEQAAVGIAHNALDGRWLRVNQKLCAILGYTREELLQKAFQEITHPDDVKPNLSYLRQLLAGDISSFSMEKRYIRKDGSVIWGNLTVSLVRSPAGEPDYLVSVVEDITARKRAEEELRFRKALLEAQTETSVDGIMVVSPDRKIISYNQRLIDMWDIPEEVLETRSEEAELNVIKDKVVDPQGFLERLNYLYEHPAEESYEEIQLKGGRTFERYSAPVTGSAGTYYGRVFFVRDITRRKRAEESLLEVRKAERRRIARDLHDVVLQDLSGTLQGLQAVQVEFESAQQKVNLKQETDALRKAVGGLRGVLHDLRNEKDQPFVKAIEALVEYNRQQTPDRQVRLSIQEDFPQELPEAVKVELLRTVQEALTNVRQHAEAQWVGVKLYKPGEEKVCVQVVDDGLGFDSESVRRGLGLLGMHERIESFGGDLEIRSEAGKGTMVSVTVPTQALEDERGD